MAIGALKLVRETAQRMASGEWDFNAIFNREIYPALKRIIEAINQGGYTTIQEEGADLEQWQRLNFIGPGVTAENDAANSRTNVTITTGLSSIVNFDTRNDPIFLYNFDLGFTNMASTGADGDLVEEGGDVYFTHISPGRQGVYIPSGINLISTNFNSTIAHNGDITLMMMIQLDQYSVDLSFYISHGGAGETEAANIIYALTMAESFIPPRPFGWLSESGAGVNSAVDSAADFVIPPIHNMMWIGVVREGTSVSVWINGIKNNTGSITAPTGGLDPATRLRIGGFPPFTTSAHVMFGAKGVARAYTDDEMRAEYNYTLGGVFGQIT